MFDQDMCLYFVFGGTVSVKLSESGNPLKISHVTGISTFNDGDE